MKKIYSFVIFFLLVTAPGRAQPSQRWPLQVSVFSNATLPLPGVVTRLFAEPLHPGFSLGTTYTYLRKGKHALLQTAKAGYFYHRYSQHAIQLYTEAGYRLHTRPGLDAGLLLGGGYLHAIPTNQVFTWNNRGEYERGKKLGRAQVMFSTSLEFGYTTSALADAPVRFFLGYQFWLQAAFVKEYVPVLPNTTLHVGVSIPLRK